MINGASVLSDGRILSWSDDRTLRLWDGNGISVAVLKGHTDAVAGAQVTSDGRILSWSNDGELRLWDGISGAPLAVLEHRSERVASQTRYSGTQARQLAVRLEHRSERVGAEVLPGGGILLWHDDQIMRFFDGFSGAQLFVWNVPHDWERGPDVTGTAGSVRSQMRQHRLEDGEVRDVSGTQVVLTCGRHVRICQCVQAPNIVEQNLM